MSNNPQIDQSCSQMFSGYYICKILVVIACSLIQAGVTPSQMLVGCKNGSFLMQLAKCAIHNQGNHSVIKTTNLCSGTLVD